MNYRKSPQLGMNFGELVVDNFAGGGGASTGIEEAIGRPVDIAINHDPQAVAMHTVNHPQTYHYCESVWEVNPKEATKGQPVGLAWFSPDCRHFSKAKGGKPVSARVRGLAWVVMKWIGTVRPRIIILENVEEFLTWGPVVKNANGDHRPCPKRKGNTFRSFTKAIKRHGYAVEWKELRACDYGAATIRKRLFLIARCDGLPINWPAPTHGPGLKPYRTAADIIDWSLPCHSIFLTKEEGKTCRVKRPLAENTLKRIAMGIERYVINSPQPFIVGYHGHKSTRDFRGQSIQRPLPTHTAKNGIALVTPFMVPRYGERPGQAPRTRSTQEPLATVVTTNNQSQLVTAFLAKHYTGVVGQAIDKPTGTVTSIDHHALVTSNLVVLRNNCYGKDIRQPLQTITSCGHFAEVRAFLMKYYGTGGQWQSCDKPLHTVPTKARMGLVTVAGSDYQIIDIGMRMLSPRELFSAQGFSLDYIINRDSSGKPIAVGQQVAKCGNSVCPPLAEAIVKANYAEQEEAKFCCGS